jgi:uncharacterized membrane protein
MPMKLIRLLKHDLAREVSCWEGEGIISKQQAGKICARYGMDFDDLSQGSRGHRILVGLGYLFIGLALITLISANWDEIPRGLRMAGLFVLTLSANLLGLMRYRRENRPAAVGWFLLGALFYGASIMLIAQIYHIGEHYPDGIFWWAVGVLPMALLLQSITLMLLATALGFIWFFVEASLNFYPLLFPLIPLALVWFLRQGRESGLLFLVLMVAIGRWAEYTLAWIISDRPGFLFGEESLVLGGGLLLLFHGIAVRLMARKEHLAVDYGTLLELWVLRLTLFVLLVFSFREPWEELIYTSWAEPGPALGAALLLSLVALVLVHDRKSTLEVTAFFAVLYVAGVFVVTQLPDSGLELQLQVVVNLVLIATGIGLILKGLHHHISHYFYLGVVTILLTGLLRYFDLVGDYIGASMLFALFAAILLSAAKYWKIYLAREGGTS